MLSDEEKIRLLKGALYAIKVLARLEQLHPGVTHIADMVLKEVDDGSTGND